MKSKTVAKIVDGIWKDICGRSGGDHFLETIDEEIQEEIKESWSKIIEKAAEREYLNERGR